MDKVKQKLCPECKGNIFHIDETRAETTCKKCGLVLLAPPQTNIIYPGFIFGYPQKIIHVTIKNQNIKKDFKLKIISKLLLNS